ncbi:MAG: hypothetical protein PWQ96_1524 [Clostridia bacterium]|nr:hypothetical protein [Clostridia bacterium]
MKIHVNIINQPRLETGIFYVLVEARGIEPLSEGIPTRASPSAVCALRFHYPDAHRQASVAASPISFPTGYQALTGW